MEVSFNPIEFGVHVAQELVTSFTAASRATTAGLVGSARENSVRKKLEQLLPPGVGVGTGCVIDSYGKTSKQQDIILYEREFCPVFSINETPETTFFPCEGVIAVGEVKSTLGKKELQDIFSKIKSVKSLKRYSVEEKSQLGGKIIRCFRSYGSKATIEGTPEEDFDQTNKPLDQIYGFALAGEVKLKTKTFCGHLQNLFTDSRVHESPNSLIILDGGIVTPLAFSALGREQIPISRTGASCYYYADKGAENFQFLLSRIYSVYRRGRTVPLSSYHRYIVPNGVLSIPLNGTTINI